MTETPDLREHPPVLQLSGSPDPDVTPGAVTIELTNPPRGRDVLANSPRGRSGWTIAPGQGLLLEMAMRVAQFDRPGEPGQWESVWHQPEIQAGFVPDWLGETARGGTMLSPPVRLEFDFGDGRQVWVGSTGGVNTGPNGPPWGIGRHHDNDDLRNWGHPGLSVGLSQGAQDGHDFYAVGRFQYDSAGPEHLSRPVTYPEDTAHAPVKIRIGAMPQLLDRITWRLSEIRLWWIDFNGKDPPRRRLSGRRLTGREPGLAGYWRVDEGRGTTLHDATGAGNHGEVTGEARWLDSCEFQLDAGVVKLEMARAALREEKAGLDGRRKAIADFASQAEDARKRAEIVDRNTQVVKADGPRAVDRLESERVQLERAFAAWQKDNPLNTTIKDFLTNVAGRLDRTALEMARRGRPLQLDTASLETVWLAGEGASVEGEIKEIHPLRPVVVETATEHGLTSGDRVVLSGIAGDDTAALLNNRSFRIRVQSARAFTLFTLSGQPEDGRMFRAPRGGKWSMRDQFHIVFPEADEPLGDDVARLSRFRFDFTPTPRTEAQHDRRDPPNVRGYSEGFARRKLTEAGFRAEVFEVAMEDPALAGLVVDQSRREDPETADPTIRILIASAPARGVAR